MDKKEDDNVYFMPNYLNAAGENKCVILYGNTRIHKDEISQLEFKFNKNLTVEGNKVPGWYYPKSKIKNMENFVNSLPFNVVVVESSESQSSKFQASKSQTSKSQSSKSQASKSFKTQKIIYTVEKPDVGDNVKIEFSDMELEGIVTEITNNGDFIDKISVKIGEDVYPVFIVSGSWQIIEFCNDHEVFFKTPV